MSKTQLILVLAVLGAIGVSQVNATCGDCNQNSYAACINETAFYLCFDGSTKSDQIGTCGAGKVCTTQSGICKLESEAQADCESGCNVCLNAKMACVSQNEFVMCDAGEASTPPMTCPEKRYCNIKNYVSNGVLCVDTCYNEPTCANIEVTTPDPTENYESSCDGITTTGLYPNLSDKTCKTYVYCETLEDVPYSILYTCAEGTYFSSTTKKCVSTKPTGCT